MPSVSPGVGRANVRRRETVLGMPEMESDGGSDGEKGRCHGGDGAKGGGSANKWKGKER